MLPPPAYFEYFPVCTEVILMWKQPLMEWAGCKRIVQMCTAWQLPSAKTTTMQGSHLRVRVKTCPRCSRLFLLNMLQSRSNHNRNQHRGQIRQIYSNESESNDLIKADPYQWVVQTSGNSYWQECKMVGTVTLSLWRHAVAWSTPTQVALVIVFDVSSQQ